MDNSINPRQTEVYPVFRMKARVDDAVHVQVEVVELDAVRVRPGRVYWDPDPIDHYGSFFADLHHGKGVTVDQPPVKSRNSHLHRRAIPDGFRVLEAFRN